MSPLPYRLVARESPLTPVSDEQGSEQNPNS